MDHATNQAGATTPDRPDATSVEAPPADWVGAVTRATRYDGTDFGRLLHAAQERAELAERRAGDAEARADGAERRIAALERALTSRPGIEQAKGVLMAVFGLNADAAFDALTWVSQNANIKLTQIANRFITSATDADLSGHSRDSITTVLANLSVDPSHGARAGHTPHPDGGDIDHRRP